MRKSFDELLFYVMIFNVIVLFIVIVRAINFGYERTLAIYGGINFIVLVTLYFKRKKRKVY